jgi:tRNA A37 N6-isopentenylltransferase MiaA
VEVPFTLRNKKQLTTIHSNRIIRKLEVFMIIFTPILETEKKENLIIPKYDGVKMTREEYRNWNPEEPGIKYEWSNGVLEATEKLKFQEQIE